MLRTLVLLFMSAVLVSGCATMGYYMHAVGGQLDLLARAQPIEELLNGSESGHRDRPPPPPELQHRLGTVLQIRTFASQALALPDNGSYRQYVELDRAAVAWNVIAAPEFSLRAERWCYPFAGCVPYRGFFAHDRAERYADDLRQAGKDVRIASVAAYSTLGWFRDPLLSTQLRRNDTDLAALLFHELAHQQLYVTDDAAFNESFATFVEQQGVERWLAEQGRTDAHEAWLVEQARHAQFIELLREYRVKLESIFDSGADPDRMRRAKAECFEDLRAAYRELRSRWDNDPRYDSWFAQDLNNAHLAGVDLYHRHVPAFAALFRGAGGDFGEFYRAARAISRLPADERNARLATLADPVISAR